MNTVSRIKKAVGQYRGRMSELRGAILARFDDPDDARDCAKVVRVITGKVASACGCQVTVTL